MSLALFLSALTLLARILVLLYGLTGGDAGRYEHALRFWLEPSSIRTPHPRPGSPPPYVFYSEI